MHTKRTISVYEKSSLKETWGKALIFLGPNGCPEIKELLDAGFSPLNIVGLDKNETKPGSSRENIALAISTNPLVPPENFYFMLFRDFYMHGKNHWSYVHLDYCGLAFGYRLNEVSCAAQSMTSGRLRVTFMARKQHRNSRTLPYFDTSEIVAAVNKRVAPRGFVLTEWMEYVSSEYHSDPMVTMWFDKQSAAERDRRLPTDNSSSTQALEVPSSVSQRTDLHILCGDREASTESISLLQEVPSAPRVPGLRTRHQGDLWSLGRNYRTRESTAPLQQNCSQ